MPKGWLWGLDFRGSVEVTDDSSQGLSNCGCGGVLTSPGKAEDGTGMEGTRTQICGHWVAH